MGFMSNILSKSGLGALAVGAALALSPMKANAVTILNISDAGGVFDLLADNYQFQDVFLDGTPANTLSFTFENTSAVDARVVLSSATINQISGSVFTGGASVGWVGAGNVTTAAEGVTSSGQLSFILAAGASDTLNLSFGNVLVGTNNPNPDVDFFVTSTPVPIPAAGLMLLTALGGMAVMRRRRKAA